MDTQTDRLEDLRPQAPEDVAGGAGVRVTVNGETVAAVTADSDGSNADAEVAGTSARTTVDSGHIGISIDQ